jgi:hypothetical protein
MHHACWHTHTPRKMRNMLMSFKLPLRVKMAAMSLFWSMYWVANWQVIHIIIQGCYYQLHPYRKMAAGKTTPLHQNKQSITSPITHTLLTCVPYLPKYKTRIFTSFSTWKMMSHYNHTQSYVHYTLVFPWKCKIMKRAIYVQANTVCISRTVCTHIKIWMYVNKSLNRQLMEQHYSTKVKAFAWHMHVQPPGIFETGMWACVFWLP